jgi:hypothetical protein
MNTLEEDGGEEMCDAPRSTASPVEEAGYSGTGKVDGGGGEAAGGLCSRARAGEKTRRSGRKAERE